MNKLTNKILIKVGLLFLATVSTLTGYSQDTYEFKELLRDNSGLIFSIQPTDDWAKTTEANLPNVLGKVYDVEHVELKTVNIDIDGDFVFTKYQQTILSD